MDKIALYNAIAQHETLYQGNNPATGFPWTTAERIDDIMARKAEADAKIAELEAAEAAAAADPVAEQAAIDRHDAVNTWLENLKATDPEQFDQVRKLSFDEQATLAGV